MQMKYFRFPFYGHFVAFSGLREEKTLRRWSNYRKVPKTNSTKWKFSEPRQSHRVFTLTRALALYFVIFLVDTETKATTKSEEKLFARSRARVEVGFGCCQSASALLVHCAATVHVYSVGVNIDQESCSRIIHNCYRSSDNSRVPAENMNNSWDEPAITKLIFSLESPKTVCSSSTLSPPAEKRTRKAEIELLM
jgi:hypothetical protein